ncbi:MAG: hypothetical protein P8Y00_12375 [Deltaproteobacteria bacterium]
MDFYLFVEGPLLWIAFLVFIIGSLLRVAMFLVASTKKDKIIYQHFSWKYALSTIGRWLLPINKSVSKNPVFSILGYIFHICLIVVPIWFSGHNSSDHRALLFAQAHFFRRHTPHFRIRRLSSHYRHRIAVSNRIFSDTRNVG